MASTSDSDQPTPQGVSSPTLPHSIGYGSLNNTPARSNSRSFSAHDLRFNSSSSSSSATNTPSPSRNNLWRAVSSSITAANALRRRQTASTSRNSRIDAEGMSGTIRPLSGTDHWQNLAHLFEGPQSPTPRADPSSSPFFPPQNPQGSTISDRHLSPVSSPRYERRNPMRPPSRIRTSSRNRSSLIRSSTSSVIYHSSTQEEEEEEEQSTATPRPTSPPQLRSRMLSPPPNVQRNSFATEPDSMLNPDPDSIPDDADPLEYADGDDLLDDDSEEEDEENAHRMAQARLDRYRQASWRKKVETRLKNLFAGEVLSVTQKGILKCAIAYYIGELFTFSKTLSDWTATLLPNHDPDVKVPLSNLHMVATIAVYFHPAKTLGAMLEADIFALLAFLYSVALGVSSMAMAVWLHDAGHPVLSNVISVLLFLGVGMALVGYSKITMGKPTFNTACSMIGVIVFTVIAKEGSAHLGVFSADKIWQVSIVVAAGTLVSNVICFLIWPQSACTNLQEDIVRNLSGFSTLLKVLTKTFLLDDPSQFHYNSERIKRAIDNHHASFISLRKNLEEARMEAFVDARMRHVSGRYVKVVESMNRLAQHLTGLRSSCGLQHQIMVDRQWTEAANAGVEEEEGEEEEGEEGDPFADPVNQQQGSEDSSYQRRKLGSDTLQAHASSFEHFAANIGPHMRSLVFTCTRTLRRARGTFTLSALPMFSSSRMNDRRPSAVSLGSDDFLHLIENLSAALRRFEKEQTVSIKRMYTLEPTHAAAEEEAETKRRSSMMATLSKMSRNGSTNGTHLPVAEGEADEVLRAHIAEAATRYGGDINPDEEVFLVFFFVFNLEEFAKECSVLLRELGYIRAEEDRIARRRRLGLARWMFWRRGEGVAERDGEGLKGKGKGEGGVGSFFQWIFRRGPWRAGNKTSPIFPSARRHQVDTAQTPKAQTFRQKVQRIVWTIGEFLRKPDTKFAIKTGLGAAALASPAFISATRPIFTEYQGQWALVSFMVVLSPTVGQSNQMSVHRVVGTIFGALVAYGAYTVFPDDHIALPIVGVLFSLPCFRYIVAKPQYASSARFVLLTYNLTALYSYNVRIKGIEVEQVAFHRTVAVVIGVVWATLLNLLIWPFEARRELGVGVSDLLFKLAWLYQRLVLTYSSQDATVAFDEDEDVLAADPEAQPLLRSTKQDRIDAEFQAIELHLQLSIIKLEGLLAQTRHEPRLKGPFPISTYKALLGCCQSILDKLHSMRCVTARDAWHRNVRRDFVIPVNAQRREMVGNVLLFFWLLGSAFHLKTPMPPYMPPVKSSREALISRIRELPAVKRRAIRGSSEYLLFYSYVLAMKDVIDQLLLLGEITQQLFGVLGGSIDNFEAQFLAAVDSTDPTPRASRRGSVFH
ncbi:hypothetical protein A4X09_0g2142 [Tilletia walkeri]|uniref:DUF2421 domain-containing protein n=1 Tax=Tilletia walkeri TaxID=117179 RepID=A0A8X7T7D2_9BASI|nr:hypothetical protein A4X09_0g2142 [Tilletia walkeri]